MSLMLLEGRRFWSVTMYRASDLLFFGDLPYDKATNTYRYNINPDTPGFDYNKGIDFTIYISAAPPPKGTAANDNWLPVGKVPNSKFTLVLRQYGPDEEAVAGRYDPPPIVAHKGTWGQGPAHHVE